MKKTFLIIAFYIITISANAQAKTVSNHSLTIYTIGASYSYEQTLGGKMTIIAHADLLMSHMVWTPSGFEYAIQPGLGLESRFYYNIGKRHNSGKNISYNSANYLSLECMYLFEPMVSQRVIFPYKFHISPNWGIRRVYNDRWLLEFNPGIYFFVDSLSKFSWRPRINLKFGIVF